MRYSTDATKKTEIKYEERLAQARTLSPMNQDVIDALMAQMEHTRNQEGFSTRQFSKLLGLNESYYYKITRENRRNFSLDGFLTFCRLYGFDISTLVGNAYLESTDSVLRELAVYCTTLSKETIDLIEKAILLSHEKDETKERGSILLQYLQKIDKPEYPMFAADATEEQLEAAKQKIEQENV